MVALVVFLSLSLFCVVDMSSVNIYRCPDELCLPTYMSPIFEYTFKFMLVIS